MRHTKVSRRHLRMSLADTYVCVMGRDTYVSANDCLILIIH